MWKNKNLKITLISHSYPDERFPTWGIFIRDQAKWLHTRAKIQVIAPRPRTLFPLYLKRKWYYYSQMPFKRFQEGIKVFRPQYLTLPGRLLIKNRGKSFAKVVLPTIIDKPNIFHVHFAYPDACVISELKKKYPDVPVILSIHGSDWYAYWNKPNISKQILLNLRLSDKIITVGQQLKTDIANVYPDLDQKIQVIPNGVEISETNKITQNNNTFINKEKIKILVVASYVGL